MKRSFSSRSSEKEDEDIEEDAESIEARIQKNSSPKLTLSGLDVLECPICKEFLSPPVYQCENGHLVCDPCCSKIGNTCPSCRKTIGRTIRCRAIEKILETTKISCKNVQYGCMEEIRYTKKLDHEAICKYAPCTCPHPSCDYVGMSKCLYRHFSIHHKSSLKLFNFGKETLILLNMHDKHQFLQAEDNTILAVTHSFEPFGSVVNVVSIAPNSSKKEYSYHLSTRLGKTTIEIRSIATFTSNWGSESQAEHCLIVPNSFIDSSGLLKLVLYIYRRCR